MNKAVNSIFLAIEGCLFLIFLSGCGKEKDTNDTNNRTTAVFNDSLSYGTLTDQDGNKYKTITIGTQTWMAENLRTTKYNDGSLVPHVAPETEWSALTTGAYCNYNNTLNPDTISTYGRIYNWEAVNTGKLAPVGWHVPTDDDWEILVNYLGGTNIAGNHLKEAGSAHWRSPNTSADNSSGFTALPAGSRCFWDGDEQFGGMDWGCGWWSSDLWYGDVWLTMMDYNSSSAYLHAVNLMNGVYGFPVRCIKD